LITGNLQKLSVVRTSGWESYVKRAPEALEGLEPEERHQVYKLLRLEVAAVIGGEIEVTGDLIAGPEVCNLGTAYGPKLGKS
jgi:hypothetical protein